ncbi:CHUK, partial [Symbiodinium sp. KB8]
AGGSQNRQELLGRTPTMYFALFLAGLLAGEAVRVGELTGQEKVNGSAVEQKAGGMMLGRLRAFDESGLRKLAQDPTVELFAPSFMEEDVSGYELPARWRSELTIVKKLGEGSFGKVFLCQVPRMPLMNHGELWDLIVKCSKQPNCGTLTWPRKAWNWVNPMYNEAFMLLLFHDIVSGVQALHQRGLLHTDLKPANVMMNCVGSNCYAAVIDLGLVCQMNDAKDCGWQGTPGYIPWEIYPGWAPEGSNSARYASRDVWALGAILYELLYSYYPPFLGDRDGSKVFAYDASVDENIPNPRTATDQLVVDMLAHDYHIRPSLEQILRRIEEILIAKDFTTYQKTKSTPSARHATSPVPTCLLYPTTRTTTTLHWAGPGRWVPTGQHVPPSGGYVAAGYHQPAPLGMPQQPQAVYRPRPAFRPYTGNLADWTQMQTKYCHAQPKKVSDRYCVGREKTPCCSCWTKRNGHVKMEYFRSNDCR